MGHEEDRLLIDRCLSALAHDHIGVRAWRTLAGSASGAAVYLVEGSGGDVVLKATTSEATAAGARRELNFYRALADDVPVRTPRVLGLHEEPGLSCLLLEVALPPREAAAWSGEQWVEAAAQLGRLHHPAVVETSQDAPCRLGRRAAVEDGQVEQAASWWRQLGQERLALPWLERLDDVAAALDGPPECLIHGDWHVGNLLRDPDGQALVWTDWQEVRLGHGPEDLALLWQRAEFDGGTPPREAMLEAYARERGIPIDATFRRAIVAAELLILLFGWPPWLLFVEPARREVLLGRMADFRL
ncbi:MAG TPA: aminoglycoside phosphotransferase family protein [Actinopolymorphaceae bacterium]